MVEIYETNLLRIVSLCDGESCKILYFCLRLRCRLPPAAEPQPKLWFLRSFYGDVASTSRQTKGPGKDGCRERSGQASRRVCQSASMAAWLRQCLSSRSSSYCYIPRETFWCLPTPLKICVQCVASSSSLCCACKRCCMNWQCMARGISGGTKSFCSELALWSRISLRRALVLLSKDTIGANRVCSSFCLYPHRLQLRPKQQHMALLSSQKILRFLVTSNLWSYAWSIKYRWK